MSMLNAHELPPSNQRVHHPLNLRAMVHTVNQAERTVELTFTSGGRVIRTDWRTGVRYYEVLSLDAGHVRLQRLNSGAPVLDAHASSSVRHIFGVVVEGSARILPNEGRCRVKFSERPGVEPIWRDVQTGIIRNVSVGYVVHKFKEIPVTRNGELPTRLAIDWEPYEVSLVPMGADDGAKVRESERFGAVLMMSDADRNRRLRLARAHAGWCER